MWNLLPHERLRSWQEFRNRVSELPIADALNEIEHLSKHDVEIEIRVYIDPVSMEQYNLVYVDKGKYVLNLVHDEVVNSTQVPKEIKLKKIITSKELALENLF